MEMSDWDYFHLVYYVSGYVYNLGKQINELIKLDWVTAAAFTIPCNM